MEVPRIDYAPPIPLRHRRKSRRIIIAAVTLAILVPSLWVGVPVAWRRLQLAYWQRQALNYSPPADQIVYDDIPADVPKLLKDPNYAPSFYSFAAFRTTPAWQEFTARLSPPGRTPAPVLFMHERTTPDGARCLVEVEGYLWGTSASEPPELAIVTIIPVRSPFATMPATGFQIIAVKSGSAARPPGARWFAGQIDPNDGSHFIVHCEGNGQSRVIDGWLTDDHTVKLQER